MKIKIKSTKSSLERKMMEAIVLNEDYLKLYQHLYRKQILTIGFGEWLSEECLSYYKKFGTAPKADIKDIFKSAVKSRLIPEGLQDMLADFLKNVNFETTPTINHGYLADKTRKHFVLKTHERLKRRLELALEAGDAELCEQAVAELRAVKLNTAQVCTPFEDKQKVMDAFLKDEKILFKLPGAIGMMMNPNFKAKRFVALLGTAKRGKTWWLYRLAKAAKHYGNHVAVFAAGDEDEDSSIVRFGCMLTGKNPDKEYTGKMAVPVMDCIANQEGGCPFNPKGGMGLKTDKEDIERMTPEQLLEENKKHVPCTRCRGVKGKAKNFLATAWYKWDTVEQLSWQSAWKSFTKFHKLTPRASLKLFSYSSDTLTVAEINRQLDMAEDNEGWVPTVVIIDYPDIMDHDSNEKEKRHTENAKWIGIRKMTQDRSVLGIVVSQSNMGGYGADSLDTTNVNEDRRKLDHVTALYGLNQTDQEKRKRIARIGPLLQRRGKFDTEYQIFVLQCLEKGNPFLDTELVYRKKMKTDKK